LGRSVLCPYVFYGGALFRGDVKRFTTEFAEGTEPGTDSLRRGALIRA
jgi:hypothetical protein